MSRVEIMEHCNFVSRSNSVAVSHVNSCLPERNEHTNVQDRPMIIGYTVTFHSNECEVKITVNVFVDKASKHIFDISFTFHFSSIGPWERIMDRFVGLRLHAKMMF
eukprot:Lithocolla_globosa_v1_NODE_371_length_4267_cov_4.198718.p5 type:complete len:106 gc:universal NODE_371_length_4267_cov_4.198718:672-989(+)